MKLFLGEKCFKELAGLDVRTALERVDLVSRDQAQMSVFTLEAVYGLVQSMRLFIASEQTQLNFNH